MLRITSYLHRQELYDIIIRWMYSQPAGDDAQLITRLVHYNNTFVSRYLNHFSHQVFSGLHCCALEEVPARKKRHVKEAIVDHPHYLDDRLSGLIDDYRARPDRFFNDTPVHGSLFFASKEGGKRLVGSNRIKRVRRLAEKIARRIIDSVFEAIKIRADELAGDRAKALGISLAQLVTSPDAMIEEFGAAEARILDDLRTGRAIPATESFPDMVIDDVAGIKVILEANEQHRIFDYLEASEDCQIIDVEPHFGNYNATNIIVQYRPPKAQLLDTPLSGRLLDVLRSRGVDTADAQRSFEAFVLGAEETVNIEVILSSFREVVESEIGRCMHEDRIIEQRLRQEYRGHLAKNISYLVQYLFAFANSPTIKLDEIPIKLWNRYLPDYFDEVVKALYGIPPFHLTE